MQTQPFHRIYAVLRKMLYVCILSVIRTIFIQNTGFKPLNTCKTSR